MATFNILLSCMHQKDYDIINKSNIKCGAVIINQCDVNNIMKFDNNILWIDSTERGLSRSRNLAIQTSNADICLIADDDEVFVDECEDIIIKAFSEIKDADIIVFDLNNHFAKLKNKKYKLWKYETLRVTSYQIAFRRNSIVTSGVNFDIKLGAGTGNGAGEENKFLLDCYNKNINIYHYPAVIATLKDSNSTWFNGYNENFFYQRGMVTRYYLGLGFSCLYALYYVLIKRHIYSKDINMCDAAKSIFEGIFDDKLD